MRKCVVVGLLAMALVAGCDAGDAEQAELAPPLLLGEGVIRGPVTFIGRPPEMKTIRNEPCHEGAAAELKEETVVVNDNGTLRNVLVYLEGAGRADGSKRKPVVLDQVHCRYEPHVLGVQVGQPLVLRSSDPTLHNVHYVPAKNPQGNFGFSGVGGEKTVSFDKAEIVRMKCDVHPWMTAYVGVFENPFFAVTGEDGSFEIKQVPPGDYTLVAWHERYGKLEQALSVESSTPIEAAFEYRQP